VSSNALRLDDPLDALPGLSPARRTLLGKLGLETVAELLGHFPRDYQDLSDRRRIFQLSAGTLQTVEGEVVEIDIRTLADGRPVVSVVINDGGEASLEGVWFNQTGMARRFRYGQRVAFSGKPRWYKDHWQMTSPRVRELDSSAGSSGAEVANVVPVYPLTEDLRLEQLRPVIRRALELYAKLLPEPLPRSLREQHGWPTAERGLWDIHFPENVEAAARARRRFIYEELLILQLALGLRRREVRDRQRAPKLATTRLIDAHIRRLFPFEPTSDQNKAIADVCADLASERPMQRLVQADVGAGKTAVAVYALLVAVANKHQAALMAPTEVLARQHFRTLERYLAHSRVHRLLLTGSLSPRERAEALTALKAGEIDLVVGTQSLVQEGVEFAKLGVVVIDEQHKFGVHQRAKIRALGVDPHYLVMTATPIPRTVALTVFGDLDLSVIRELPPGRQPVRTRWVEEDRRTDVYAQVRQGLEQGRQAYVVCPLVEESDALFAPAAVQRHEELSAGPFKDFSVALLHGRMDEAEKAQVMERFRTRQVDLLVCTSVVEVGVDVPTATQMVIENAERFGLSQLHQLRGRVSRGPVAGTCYLFGAPPTEDGQERLRAFVRTADGFQLAEIDAELRGTGEIFGTRQHGVSELRLASLPRDSDVLALARRDAFALIAQDARLAAPELAGLRRLVLERYGGTLELAEVG
jgi:ATP-dependent DNA helicase RecG